MSCGSNNLPFTGEKMSSLRTGANFKFQISRNGNTRITVSDISSSYVLYDGIYNKDSIVVKGEGAFIIKKDYTIYYQGSFKDTLWY